MNICYRSFIAKAMGSALWVGVHLFLLSSVALSQTVSGTVTDAQSGETLPGVNVTVKGTTTGTSTGAEGEYELNVPSLQDTLVFSFVGYQTREEPINGRAAIDVALQSQAITGEEMVVVGYGTQEQQDVTGAVESVDMESISNTSITGANEALSGQIAGVQVSSTQGIPGGGPQIQIRGVNAVGAGSSPLYVVDGFPLPQSDGQISNPLNQIAPSDIESMSVLKGPSATAIYGSRASNGVIIIETKGGNEGELQFNAEAYTGWQSIPSQQVIPMMDAREFASFMKQSIEDQNRVANQNEPIPEEYQNPSQYGEGTDWFEELTRIAPQQKVSISASGGNESITSYLSAGYLRQDGVVLGTNYNQVSLRSNIKANISENLTIGVNFNPTYSYGNNAVTGGQGREGYFGEWTTLSPIPSVYKSDGTYNEMIGSTDTFNYPNPVMALKQAKRRRNATRIIGSGFASYDLTDGLTFRTSVNADWQNINQDNYTPSTIGALFEPPPTIPSGSFGQNRYLNWANENRITFEHNFTEDHKVNLMGNFSVQQQLDNSANFTGDEFGDDAIQTLNAAPTITGETNATSWSLVSYIARLNYTFLNRYLLTATVRRDGSSRFGPNSRWGTFPSAALGWRISDEPWMNSVEWLSNLKLKASYGMSGNNQIGNFGYISQLGSSNYILGNSLSAGRAVNSISNPNLKWEKTKAANIGLEAGFLNNRISITANIYRSRTEDLLLNLNIPESSGYSSSIQNIGKIENKGFELQVKSDNFVGKDFSWNTNLNFSLNRNKTLELGPEGTPITSGNSAEGHVTHITKIGEPLGQFYGYKFLGLYTPDQIDDPDIAKFSGAIPGNMRVEDVDGDGKISPVDDFTAIGNPHPKFTYGITNTLQYKRLSLNVVISGSYGAERMKMNYATLHNIDGVFNVPKEMKKRYRSPENPGDGRHPTTAGSGQGRVMYRDVSSLNVFNASYLWLKNVTLGYRIPESIAKGRLSNIKIYGSIQNAFVITPYPNGNPATTAYNTDNYGGALAPGVDYTPYPTPRVFTVGLNINF